MRLRTLTITAGLIASAAVPLISAGSASAATANHVYAAITVKVNGKTCSNTAVNGITSNGTIIGTENCGRGEAFTKAPGGKAKLYELPAKDAHYTYASNIASNGMEAFVGSVTKTGPQTSYLLAPNGTLTVVSDPAAKGHSTIVNGVNRHGVAVGYYCTNSTCSKTASFTFQGSVFTPWALKKKATHGSQPSYITDAGVIFGTYYDSHNAAHGFQLNTNGSIKTINAAGAGKKAHEGTFLLGAANNGSTCGQVVGANHGESGFVDIRGKSHVVNVQPKGPKVYFFTSVFAINGRGEFGGLAQQPKHSTYVGFTAHR